MIKALMIIGMVSGEVYEVKLPDMTTCFAEKVTILDQVNVDSVSCIPRTDDVDPEQWRKFFGMFQGMVGEMQRMKRNRECEQHLWNDCG